MNKNVTYALGTASAVTVLTALMRRGGSLLSNAGIFAGSFALTWALREIIMRDKQ